MEVPSRDGSEAALVACVPFVPERRFGDAAGLFRATEEWYQSYAEGMGRILSAMAEPFREDRVNVLLAHLFTDGAIPGGGEHKVTIGIEYASPLRLPATACYVALGHVHRPQAVRGAPAPTSYAGSLLQLDSARRSRRSPWRRRGHPGRPAKVRRWPLGRPPARGRRGPPRPGPGRGRQLTGAYLRVFVDTEGPVPGLAGRSGRPCRTPWTSPFGTSGPRSPGRPAPLFTPAARPVRLLLPERARRGGRAGEPHGGLRRGPPGRLRSGLIAMRPVRLELKGFTSFRDPEVIDFSDLDVFAISGPTGSGKSSSLTP